jgi:hypothetical protein
MDKEFRGDARVATDTHPGRAPVSPRDDELDVLLVGRGWTSDRSWKEDVHFDQWELDPHSRVLREGRVWVLHGGANLFVTLRGVKGRPFCISRTDFVRILEKLERYDPANNTPS